MALVIRELIAGYHYLFEDLADPRAEEYFMSRSPIPVFLTLIAYLLFVFKWGPEYMKNRKPYDLKNIIIAFNAFQILINAYLFLRGASVMEQLSIFCSPVNYSNDEENMMIITCVWVYYMVKISDLLDTVFFVLRKKDNQISFLHVYHHVGMVLLSYGGVKYYAGGHSIFLGVLNAFVHLVMYNYYLLTALRPEYKENIWWKKYITQLQIVQFLLLAIIYGLPLFNRTCTYPKFPLMLFLLQNSFMLMLFCDFYRKAYLKPKKSNRTEEKEAKQG